MDRELLSYKGAVPLFLFISLMTVIQGLCIIVQAVFLSRVVSGLFSGMAMERAGYGLLFFFAALCLRHVTVFVMKQACYRFAERTGAELRAAFLKKVFERGPRAARKTGTGALVSLALEGVQQTRSYLELFFPKMAANGIIPVLILVFVFWQDWMSAVILLVTMPILIIFMILLGLAAQKKMDDRWASYRVLSNHFVDSLRGLPTLYYLGISKLHLKTIQRVSDKYRVMTMGTLRLAFLSSFALDFFTMLSIAFVAVSLGIRLVDGHILLEPALTVLILAPEYFLPVRELGQDYHATLDGKEAAAKLKAYAEQQGRAEEPAASEVHEAEWKKWSARTTLALRHVSVGYEDAGQAALKGIDLKFSGFVKIGLIGASGAGKSTLIDLLGGFIAERSGAVTLDGKPLSLSSRQWRQQVTYIPQHPYLFSATIRENIAFYTPDADEGQIHEAVRAAGLEALIDRCPDGLEERIGSGGRQLSGGQEQRVALARSFLCNRPILLLDEPTAHLDIETEYALKRTMLRLFENKLVVLATHRLHWMSDMDRIIVIRDGRIVESGSQDELIRANGAYCDMVRAQLEGI